MKVLTLLVLFAFLPPPSTGLAQPTPGGGIIVEWIRPEEVPSRADVLVRRLKAAEPDAKAESLLAEIERSLPQLSSTLDPALGRAADALGSAESPAEIEDVRRELMDAAAPLSDWKEKLESEAKRVADVLDVIAHGERVWLETQRRPETAAAGDVVVRRVESSIKTLGEASATLRAWRSRVLAASDRVIDRIAGVDAAVEKLREANLQGRASLLIPDRAPFWSEVLRGEISRELPHAPESFREYASSTLEYIRRDYRPLIVQALLTGLLMFALGRFSVQARERLAEKDIGSQAARLLERPYAIGLLLGLFASPLFHPLAPRRFMQVVTVLALFPAARIVVHASRVAGPPVFAGMFALLLIDRIRSAMVPLPTLARAAFLLNLAIGFGIALWLSHRDDLGTSPRIRRAAWLAALGLAFAFLAAIAGWTNLANLLGRGIIVGAIAALYIYAVEIALMALLTFALTSRTFRWSRLVASYPALMQHRGERALRLLAVGLWLFFVSTALGLQTAISQAATTLLNAGVSVGALSLSVGGVFAFLLTLAAAFVLARIAVRLLEEEVYPRTALPRGVPYALSSLVRYGFYSLGLLFALAAAGVQLGQVTIVLGGLGIGIGLGLQDLVKNFAAGLTLLFERRVKVGDALEMPSYGISGQVLSIGMRASVVRSWTGSEVVVPNADLISTAVTNWTLSDRLCRIEVPVGVAYGSDPDRVIALLLEAARSNERVLGTPPPQAFFKGFGESSLDFVVRAWIDLGFEQALPLTSDLGLAVHRVLNEAGIGIPFPHRDVNLASVSPAASAALTRGDGKE